MKNGGLKPAEPKFFTNMSRRKMSKADRKLLKRHGVGREYKEMGALACALERVKEAPRVPGYAVEADAAHGVRTRQRVRRERWRALWRGLFLCGAAGPSSRDRRTRSCYAEAPALPSSRGFAEAGRSSAPTVLVVVGLVVLLVAAVWLLE